MLQTGANQIRVCMADSATREDLITDANAMVYTTAVDVNIVCIVFYIHSGPQKVSHSQNSALDHEIHELRTGISNIIIRKKMSFYIDKIH